MNLFSGIERLITERGSAAVLRDRILLIKEQNESLQGKITDLEAEVEVLKKKNAELAEKANPADEKHKIKWGCLKFEGDETLYCPGCYFNRRKKIPTSRIDSQMRYCAGCKGGIPSG